MLTEKGILKWVGKEISKTSFSPNFLETGRLFGLHVMVISIYFNCV